MPPYFEAQRNRISPSALADSSFTMTIWLFRSSPYPAAISDLTGDSAKVTLEHAPDEPGTYDATLKIMLENNEPGGEWETLSIPIRLVVE